MTTINNVENNQTEDLCNPVSQSVLQKRIDPKAAEQQSSPGCTDSLQERSCQAAEEPQCVQTKLLQPSRMRPEINNT
jgi:hypothetical protein